MLTINVTITPEIKICELLIIYLWVRRVPKT